MSQKTINTLTLAAVVVALAVSIFVAAQVMRPEYQVMGLGGAGVSNFDSVTLAEDLVVGDDASVAGDLTVSGTTSWGCSDTTISDHLHVTGNITGNVVVITTTLEVNGDITLQNDETIGNAVDGDVRIGGDLIYFTNIVSKTSAYTLLATETGSLVTNVGAADSITFTLPTAVAGYNFCFYVGASDGITVTPGSGDYILHLTDAADDMIQDNTVGDSVCLTAIDVTHWAPAGEVGTWNDADH